MAARNNPPAQPTERELTITRVFAAPRGPVFTAWTAPERINSGEGTDDEYERDDTHGRGRQYAAPVAEHGKSQETPKKGDKSDDEAPDRDT